MTFVKTWRRPDPEASTRASSLSPWPGVRLLQVVVVVVRCCKCLVVEKVPIAAVLPILSRCSAVVRYD
jgi:hypothetical protein